MHKCMKKTLIIKQKYSIYKHAYVKKICTFVETTEIISK